MDIIYEPHPVSPERKAELRAKGLKIIDARFAPPAAETPDLPTREAIADMKRADVVDWLKAHGVEDPKGKLEDLRELLAAIIYTDL